MPRKHRRVAAVDGQHRIPVLDSAGQNEIEAAKVFNAVQHSALRRHFQRAALAGDGVAE